MSSLNKQTAVQKEVKQTGYNRHAEKALRRMDTCNGDQPN